MQKNKAEKLRTTFLLNILIFTIIKFKWVEGCTTLTYWVMLISTKLISPPNGVEFIEKQQRLWSDLLADLYLGCFHIILSPSSQTP